jgi:Nucleotide-diphospho-sugar transferase
MMMAKVICVQLVSMLGYNILFQDVDMIWYQNPLHYFDQHRIEMDRYDIIFQDDGGRSIRYAPYSANTGFYFVRYNDRTRHLLTSLLMSGDVVLSTHSHQQVMIALLKEHVSLFGLKVKVLSRDTEEFPGGFHYHQRSKVYMKRFYSGTVKPYIFHMSWTFNKDNKILFLRQMGEWYVNEQCFQSSSTTTTTNLNGTMVDGYNPDTFVSSCCSAEPLFSCHYRDKPSLKPCKDSPSIDKNRPSWW